MASAQTFPPKGMRPLLMSVQEAPSFIGQNIWLRHSFRDFLLSQPSNSLITSKFQKKILTLFQHFTYHLGYRPGFTG
jgi:hypothetical protein